ncbi:MAG TPA: ATP-binding cassette domain-containing protein [Coriobacteriia bacterium]|nr:ATP-binding cassette domain-containing protein [Coriobacteriia bacterium]
MIRFDNVSFSYSAAPEGRRAVDGVSFEVHPGEMVAVLGANGSGKSTLARLADGLLLPDAGEVRVDDVDTRDESRSLELRSSVGMVFQHPDDQIVATAVEDDVAFGPENLGLPREEIRRRVDAAIAAVGLSGLERREPHLLSGGQKQRLAIAGALAMSPRYLVLDEPTAMIDATGRREVADVIASMRSEGHGILLITHDLADAATADRVLVLCSGKVAFGGTLAGLLAHGSDLDAWGLEAPPIAVLATELAARGLGDGAALSPHEVVASLWP